jgi:hypothetical protein
LERHNGASAPVYSFRVSVVFNDKEENMVKPKKVKIGKLLMKDYAAAKPVALGPHGKMVSMAEAMDKPSGVASLATLKKQDQVKLAIERNRREPNFKLGIVGYGTVTKRQLLEHIQAGTSLGKKAVRAEMLYLQHLLESGRRGVKVKKPHVPKVYKAKVPAKWSWVKRPYRPFLQRSVIFCENTTDSVTSIAAAYRMEHVHPAFEDRGFNVIVLEDTDDVRSEFESRATSSRVCYISGIGHGNPSTYTGHMSDPILEVGEYDSSEVDGKSLHLLSCQTARELGPDLVTSGANSYAGFYENFTFVYDDDDTPIDEQDLFWIADSTYDICMAAGSTSYQAAFTTVAMYDAMIALVPGTSAATWLTWDRNYFKTPYHSSTYGTSSASINPWYIRPFYESEMALEKLAVH